MLSCWLGCGRWAGQHLGRGASQGRARALTHCSLVTSTEKVDIFLLDKNPHIFTENWKIVPPIAPQLLLLWCNDNVGQGWRPDNLASPATGTILHIITRRSTSQIAGNHVKQCQLQMPHVSPPR